MPTESNRPDVAVFIDFENVYVSVRDKLDANPNFESIMDRCEDFGRVVIARAYADWYRYPRVTSALYANSIEPIYVPTYYYDRDLGRTGRAIKNSVDMNLCIDAMKTLFTNTNIAKFVLATGDRDFIPLVNSIRQQGKEVIIIGVGGAASSHLAQSADEFIFYETLVGKKPAGELSKDLPRAKMPEKGRDSEAEHADEHVQAPEPAKETTAAPDIYDVLVHAINLARERGYVCSFGSLKLLMKELMGGEFKESRYKDAAGRPFAKFKDFVLEAERRGKVQVFTSGTVNEVFLPGEDPYTLSQFAQDLKEEPTIPVVEIIPEERPDTRAPSSNGRRRRRRARGGQRHTLPVSDLNEENELSEDVDVSEVLPEPVELLDEVTLADYEEPADLLDAALIDLDEEHAVALFDNLLERVEDEQNERQARVAQEAATVTEDVPAELVANDTLRPFTDLEWSVFREIVLRFERAVPFNQIHNALREARKSNDLNRTNEELRTLIKQAINTGLLERSGKGNNIVYRLVVADPDGEIVDGEVVAEPATEVAEAEVVAESAAEVVEAEVVAEPATEVAEAEIVAEPAAEVVEAEVVAEPAAEVVEAEVVAEPAAEVVEAEVVAEPAAEVVEAEVVAEPAAEVVEAEVVAEPATEVVEAVAEEAKPKRPRQRRKPAAAQPETVAAEAIEAPQAADVAEAPAEAKPKRTRRKKAEPVAEEATEPAAAEAPAEEKPKRTRRKKTESAE